MFIKVLNGVVFLLSETGRILFISDSIEKHIGYTQVVMYLQLVRFSTVFSLYFLSVKILLSARKAIVFLSCLLSTFFSYTLQKRTCCNDDSLIKVNFNKI